MYLRYTLFIIFTNILLITGCSSGDTTHINDTDDVTTEYSQFTSSNKISISENKLDVIHVKVQSTTAPRYSLILGHDSKKFKIEARSGLLTFIEAPNYETPTDFDEDNVYIVKVRADIDTRTIEQRIYITVTDLPELDRIAPTFTSTTSIVVKENVRNIMTVTAEDSTLVTYSIIGGDDQYKCKIDRVSGLLEFYIAPDYELPLDRGNDNTYNLIIQAADSSFNMTEQTITITVANADETPPVLMVSNSLSVYENQQSILTVYAYDSSPLVYGITSGGDNSQFTIDSASGDLRFLTQPNYELPTDSNHDNVYTVTVKATDLDNNIATQLITVTVLDLDEIAPHFVSESNVHINENLTKVITVKAVDSATITYAMAYSLDSDKFKIDSSSGILTFKVAPDYEHPTDSNTNNYYSLQVSATDMLNNVAYQSIIVVVNNVLVEYSSDRDGDFIPDVIENYLGRDPENSDEDNDGILDGLQKTGSFGDKFFDKQWHLNSLGTLTNKSNIKSILGNDLDVLKVYHQYMGYNGGDNIVIQIVDSGVDANHEDLTDNMDLSRSYNGSIIGDPSPNTTTEGYTHGTKVAGIIAAAAFNGKGVRGVVPFAKIAGSNWLEDQTTLSLEKAWLTGNGANEIVVSNNSWGSIYSFSTTEEDIMKLGTQNLRDGKGRIYVFAAGNERSLNADANLQYSLSNRYAIAVAALKHDNTYASYSTPGANILVSGYGGDFYNNSPTIGTTTVTNTSSNSGDVNTQTTWSNDYNENYTFGMNGTSAASPTVSGSLALVIEACPSLSWRDVKYLTAKHAKKNDTSNNSWRQNGAGFYHNNNYGFGLVNPAGMIADCSDSNYALLPSEVSTTAVININEVVPDDQTWHYITLNIVDNITIEWVETTVKNNSSWASDYDLYLLSPTGTKVDLISSGNQASEDWNEKWMDAGFRFATPAFIDEHSAGDWKLYIRDNDSGDSGTLKTVKIKVYGH